MQRRDVWVRDYERSGQGRGLSKGPVSEGWPVPKVSPQCALLGALSELGLEGEGEADGDRLCLFLQRASPVEAS